MASGKCVLCGDQVGENDEDLCDQCTECLEPTYQFSGSGVLCPEGKGTD